MGVDESGVDEPGHNLLAQMLQLEYDREHDRHTHIHTHTHTHTLTNTHTHTHTHKASTMLKLLLEVLGYKLTTNIHIPQLNISIIMTR